MSKHFNIHVRPRFIGVRKSFTMTERFETNSCVRGFHIYKDRWVPVIGKWFECKRESGNLRDRYAVAICKDDEMVGHIPRYISTSFIRLWWSHLLHTVVLGG